MDQLSANDRVGEGHGHDRPPHRLPLAWSRRIELRGQRTMKTQRPKPAIADRSSRRDSTFMVLPFRNG